MGKKEMFKSRLERSQGCPTEAISDEREFLSQKQAIMDCLRDLLYAEAEFVLLFGSWAGEGERVTAHSDVDCGVYFKQVPSLEHLYSDIPETFRARIGRKLDIICLNTADIIIANQVLRTGERVFVNSEDALVLFSAQVMSRYVDFKQSRRIIEDNILVRPVNG
jgi:predicted nucleotidyltransferase